MSARRGGARVERGGARVERGGARFAIGLSSGTSADGIDAALVEMTGEGPAAGLIGAPDAGAKADVAPDGRVAARGTRFRLARFGSSDYVPALRAAILAAAGGSVQSAADFARLDVAVGEAFADAALALARDAGIAPASLDFIASHGQTIAHVPLAGATWQLGSLAVIAERTGARVAGNFRARDVAAGGEGAPLLPYVDRALFASPREGRVLLNIGGISNVTFIPRGASVDDVVAYDLGPGNMLMDALASRVSGGAERFDAGGVRAARGRVSGELLEALLRNPFFDRAPPRSTGRETFGAAVVDAMVARGLPPDDLLATACAFTAHAITREMARWGPAFPGEYPALHVSGGGAENATLMAALAARLAPVELRRFDELGILSRAREAFSFVVLGNECLAGVPANLPRVTGARRRVVLGEVVPA